jgi:hypothetical protein
LKFKYSSMLVFAAGLLLGALVPFGFLQLFPSSTEKDWRSLHSEDSSHSRIITFQQELQKLDPPKDVHALMQQMDAQLKIEDLIIQSRAAQYANITPFTSLSSSIEALLVAIIGFVAGLFGRKRNAAAAPNS